MILIMMLWALTIILPAQISDSNVMLYNDEITDVIGITKKIWQWTLNNLGSLRLNVETDLL